MSVKEMDGENEPRGQKGLIRMDDRGNVQNPSREKDGEKFRKPEHQSREPDSEHAPEDGKKIELFPVGPSVELGLRSFVKEPTNHPDDVLNIFPSRTEGIGAKKPLQWIWISRQLFEKEKVEDVGDSAAEIAKGNGCTDAVD